MIDENDGKPLDADMFFKLKHDIRNQLSNIQLAIEGLKFETEGQEGDYDFYISSLAQSAKKIDQLLNGIE